MVAVPVATMIAFCFFLFWKRKILIKLLIATKEIRNINMILSLIEKIFTIPSADEPAKVGTMYVMDAQAALNNNQSD